MENNKLIEVKNNLSVLSELKKRLEKLNGRIYEAEKDVNQLLSKLKSESYDVEKLKKDSLSTTLLKFIGKYEGKLNKEEQEELTAKVEYDRANNRVNELYIDRDEISSRISKLEEDKKEFEEELKNREKAILNNLNNEITIKYKKLEEEREMFAKQLLEISEAHRAACKVTGTSSEVMEHLKSAEDWATYDAWTKGGMFSHAAKYEHIDNAQLGFNKLSSQLRDLQKELSDVDLFDNFQLTVIDDTTRAIDFWFDNIFTDLNVRNKIREDMDQLNRLSGKIDTIINKLEDNRTSINKSLKELEDKKADLLISQK